VANSDVSQKINITSNGAGTEEAFCDYSNQRI